MPTHTSEPTYQSEYTTTLVYNLAGWLSYQLVADHLNYFAKPQIMLVSKPVVTTFDEHTTIPTWIVKADKAKLTKKRILYLYGHVQIDSLNNASQIKHLTTDNAIVNLVTQEVSSDDKVSISGLGYHSIGMQMRGNLRNKTAELLKNVHTTYNEINKS
ncbi:Lipopolysaccharide export system protein lptC [Candidatus Moranella endobia PCVAL]|nr:Lipopolysaccharide export system protein lptC [Candidatus Moranella endobia PCVAL]